ncbi:MAG: PAS domain-containing protein [Chloroflexota bacterium]|nr:PAS domain-containing protein [Anaerolineae bacterium]
MLINYKSETELINQFVDGHQLLRDLIDHLPDGIYIKDTESRFVVANRTVAHLMGMATPDELLGKTDFEFFSPELASKYHEDEQTVMRTGLPLISQEERTFDSRTGEAGWLLTSKVPWRDRQGQIVGIMGIGRNITELKQAQEALAEAHRELEYRVQDRTLELTHSKAKLERILEDLHSNLTHITQMIHQSGPKTELLMYVEQAQKQFDRFK